MLWVGVKIIFSKIILTPTHNINFSVPVNQYIINFLEAVPNGVSSLQV